MEYIPGDNLLKMISNKSYTDVSERDIMEITVVLLKTVQFLHNNNIVHRDLKPENILFSINGDYQSLKLIDFGLSIGFREKDTYRVGSPYYMAPEMLHGEFSFANDIWSLGVILYFMITGRQPFHAKSRSRIADKIKQRKYDKPLLAKNHCSDELKDLIKKILIVELKKRITVQAMLEHPWITKSYKIQTNAQLDREILSSLKGFDQKNLLQKEILFVMARISKENEIQKLKQAFKLIDKDNSGEIEYNCIPLIFERAGITPSSKEIDSLWNSLDFHQDGKINYSEFLAATIISDFLQKRKALVCVSIFR